MATAWLARHHWRQHLANATDLYYNISAENLSLDAWVTLPPSEERQGIVYDKWPFRLDINTEYQDWILVASCVFLTTIWCLPCLCGSMKNTVTKRFTSCVYTRLHSFFYVTTCINLTILMFTIAILPDWTVDEFVVYLAAFISWVLIHLQKLIYSMGIMFGFFLLLRFRERIMVAAGMEHMTLIRFSWKEMLGMTGKKRPVEIYIWKIDDLESARGKLVKPNDVYVECHMGFNEPMRTRVHNNAGSACIVKESFQLNIDESSSSSLMTLLVKDQSLLTSAEIARLILSTRELCGIEEQTGKRQMALSYDEHCFVPLKLFPRGKIWLAISPVDDVDEERAPLMNEDALVTC